MKATSLVVTAVLALIASPYVVADGCMSDMECKGARICESGRCVYPPRDEMGAADSQSPAASPGKSQPVQLVPPPQPEAQAQPQVQAPPPAQPHPQSQPQSKSKTKPQATFSVPHYCCTSAGRLGPSPNPGPSGTLIRVGEPCNSVTPLGIPVGGTACD